MKRTISLFLAVSSFLTLLCSTAGAESSTLSLIHIYTAERRCSLPSAAARLLDTLPQGLLTAPPLASGTDDAAARYALTLRWSDGASQRITGRYDCTGLPDGWAELAAEADTLLRFYTEGELFDPSRAAAAPGPLFYCAVEFLSLIHI